MALNVINRLIGVAVELSAIVNICNYRGLHEGHHFISMAMDVHDAHERNMDCFIKECARLFHDKRSQGHLSFFFAFNFSSNMLVFFFACFSLYYRKEDCVGG